MKHKIYFFLHSFHKQFGVFSDFCVMAQGIRWLWYNNCWCLDFFGELNPVLIIILITFRVFYYFKRPELKKNYSTFILVVCAVMIVSGGKTAMKLLQQQHLHWFLQRWYRKKNAIAFQGASSILVHLRWTKILQSFYEFEYLKCGSKLKTLGASIKVVSSRPCQIRVQLFLSKKQTKDCWFLVL